MLGGVQLTFIAVEEDSSTLLLEKGDISTFIVGEGRIVQHLLMGEIEYSSAFIADETGQAIAGEGRGSSIHATK